MRVFLAPIAAASLFCAGSLLAQGAEPALSADAPEPFDAVPADAASPFGGVSISPTRVVLDNARDAAQVTLYNSGNKALTYRIEMVDLEPLEEGGYREIEEIESPVGWSVIPLVRYAPRQVTLQAGERQIVKIQARARRDTPAGEYRSHIRFSTIPLVADADAPEPSAKASGERTVSVNIGLQYRITIPLILRLGDLEEGLSVEKTGYEPTKEGKAATVEVTLRREGQQSQYVDLRVLDQAGAEAGRLKGVSVLPPLSTRKVRIEVGEARPPLTVVVESAEADEPRPVLAEGIVE